MSFNFLLNSPAIFKRNTINYRNGGPAFLIHPKYVEDFPKFNTLLFGLREMRYVSAVKKICDGCQIVRRRKAIFVICKNNVRHKQRQG